MRRLARFAPVVLLLAVWPGATLAQTGRGVGVVTTLAGTVTVARVALPGPRPLHFKDDVFVRDHIATAEKSLVRVLLGGKALVTVRELSSLTIKEETGRSTVDLTSGKIAMGVLRQRMRPGEVIEIRTPNAIAAIRGTVLVVELIPAPGGTSGQPSYTTKVHVLHGLVEVSDPRNPGAPPVQVGTLQSWSRTGSEPFSQTPLSPAAADHVFADLRSAPQIVEGPAEFMATVTTREQAKAHAVAEFLAPEMAGAGAGGDSSPATAPSPQSTGTPRITDAPVIPLVGSTAPPPPIGGAPTGQARLSYTGQTVTAPGSLYSLTGGQTDTPAVPILEAVNSSLSVGQSLMDVAGSATFASTGTAPLLYLDPSKLSAASVLTLGGGATFTLAGTLFQDANGGLDLRSDVLQTSGGASLIGSGASALVDLVGSSASSAGSLLTVSGGAVVDLVRASAPLLSLTRSAALTTERSLVDLSNGAAVKLSQMTVLSASALTIKGHGVSLAGNATMTVAGDLFRLVNGSRLTLTNGALLSLSGTSSLSVTGALVNFIGTGNTLSITNNLCGNGGCAMLGSLPVLLTGGATPANVILANPVLNAIGNGNTLYIAPGAAAISVDGAAQVKQGQ
jgi:hypothetical protein